MDVAVAGHRGDAATVRRGLASPDARVREVAVGAAARAEVIDPDGLAGVIVSDPDAGVRRRACDVAASVARCRAVVLALRRGLGDPDPLVVEAACWALGELFTAATDEPGTVDDRAVDGTAAPGADGADGGGDGTAAVVEELGVTARTHDDARAREAAVAALGSIGDRRGLAAVLGALRDRPSVRRRAVVALAAFGGEEVAAALRESAQDRDWQVREVAEILLEE